MQLELKSVHVSFGRLFSSQLIWKPLVILFGRALPSLLKFMSKVLGQTHDKKSKNMKKFQQLYSREISSKSLVYYQGCQWAGISPWFDSIKAHLVEHVCTYGGSCGPNFGACKVQMYTRTYTLTLQIFIDI